MACSKKVFYSLNVGNQGRGRTALCVAWRSQPVRHEFRDCTVFARTSVLAIFGVAHILLQQRIAAFGGHCESANTIRLCETECTKRGCNSSWNRRRVAFGVCGGLQLAQPVKIVCRQIRIHDQLRSYVPITFAASQLRTHRIAPVLRATGWATRSSFSIAIQFRWHGGQRLKRGPRKVKSLEQFRAQCLQGTQFLIGFHALGDHLH